MNWLKLISLLAAGLSAGCATSSSMKTAGPINAREELLRTDAEFSAMSKARGMATAFHHYAAEDATILPMGEFPIHGREKIRQNMLAGGEGLLTWTPQAAEVAQSGELGYTWGLYEFRGKDAEGRERLSHGKYITVWKRQPDGSWRYVLDGGNTNPPPK